MPGRYSRVLQFRIILRETKIPVWRQILVPEIYTFWDLHVAIQDSMGWMDRHLHLFEVTHPESGIPVTLGIPDDEFPEENPTLGGWEVPIADYFPEPGAEARYLYDFGDGWDHLVTLEGILLREKGKRYPRCLDGRRRCPPEDCGGAAGYEHFLEVMADPDHEEHADMVEWIRGSYDPDAFDARKVRFDNPEKRWRLAFGRE